MENLIGLKEFRENVGLYTQKISQGQTFVVLKKSKPLFRISPIEPVGDEEAWETIVDFTKIKKGGVPIQDIVAAISYGQTSKSTRKAAKRA